jgi:phosphohistidine swiveling domain-containing protein
MLILQAELKNFNKEIGNKTKNLEILKQNKISVPNFYVLPTSSISKLADLPATGEAFNLIKRQLSQASNSKKFAVRSSSLTEDNEDSAQAGKFLSMVDLNLEEIPKAILSVIGDAKIKLNGRLELFSIIIQDYIRPDLAGVCFTRNPLGSREIVIEYNHGAGEDLVLGKIKPSKFCQYWNQGHSKKIEITLPGLLEAVKKIEQDYKYPQDIEWVLSSGELWVVQTRPITSINQSQYNDFKFLDLNLPKEDFYFKKNELYEIAPRPSVFTLDLLEKIYAKNGPVDLVYKRYGISYNEKQFLKLVGNELYSDQEEEIKTLLPAYSYFPFGKLGWRFFSGSVTTLKNILNLNLIKTNNGAILFKRISDLLAQEGNNNSPIEVFLDQYKTIFEVNLLAAKAIDTLNSACKRLKLNPLDLIQSNIGELPELSYEHLELLGNSLEVSDCSTFQAFQNSDFKESSLDKLNKFNQTYLKPIVDDAKLYSRLREFGRWLTVKHITAIRKYILELAAKKKLTKEDLIYFSRISELEKIQETELLSRATNHNSQNHFTFPSTLASFFTDSKIKVLGVSPGLASGVLKNSGQITKHRSDVILLTEYLTPDLIALFPYIKGIISRNGGLLSHLSIMAREYGLPVIIVDSNQILKLGTFISFDASLASITTSPS